LDDDNSGSEVGDVEVGVLGVELINGLLGEVAGNVEVSIGNEEVWEGFLNVALDVLVWWVGGTSLGEHLGVKLLES